MVKQMFKDLFILFLHCTVSCIMPYKVEMILLYLSRILVYTNYNDNSIVIINPF